MNLEFLPDGSPDCPLIIFSWSVPEGAEQLRGALRGLASSSETAVEIHALPFISPVDGCQLSAHAAKEDVGARPLENAGNRFTWSLTRRSWQNALDLLGTMTRQDVRADANGCRFQWLDDAGGIDVLISTHRSW